MAESSTIVVADPAPAMRDRLVALATRAAADVGKHVQAYACANGLEAAEKIQALAPCLVICEVALEGLNGLALLRKLRREAEQNEGDVPPFVYVTSFTRETDRYWGLRNGAHAYVTKPFDDNVLRARLGDVLSQGQLAMPDSLHDLL